MMKAVKTNNENTDFVQLVESLNAYLAIIDGEDHTFYKQYNTIDVLKHVVVVYLYDKAVGCGAFKPFNKNSVEIKRMYTVPERRRKGVAEMILLQLENWARDMNYSKCILETGKRQIEAIKFYKQMNYTLIPNYGPYKNVENSLCFKKELL